MHECTLYARPVFNAGCFQSAIIKKNLHQLYIIMEHRYRFSIFEFQIIEMKIKINNFEFRSEIKSHPKV